MSGHGQNHDFDGRLMRYLDGGMDAAELAAFDAELAGDADKRAALVTAALHGRLIASRLATQLPVEWGALRTAKEEEVVAEPAIAGRIGRSRVAAAAIAAAVLIGGAAVGVYVAMSGAGDEARMPERMRPVAVVIDAGDAEWNTEPLTSGQDVAGGVIDLGGGAVELAMRGGASVRLTGPVRATLATKDRVVLERGTLEARIDGGGFAVDVPGDVRVTDIGTAFGVSVAEDGRATVRVTEGRVRVDRPIASANPGATLAIVELTAGDRAVVNADRYGEALRVERDLAVVNASFEADGGGRTGGPMPSGWRSAIGGRAGCEDHVSNGNFAAGGGVDGRFVGLVNYRLHSDPPGAVSAIVQDTGHRVEPGFSYELTVAIGRRIDHDARGAAPTRWRLSLVDADSAQVLATTEGQLTGSGVMTDRTLAYTPAADHVGLRLGIVLANPQDADADANPGQTNFDRVRLTRITPLKQAESDEPSPSKETR